MSKGRKQRMDRTVNVSTQDTPKRRSTPRSAGKRESPEMEKRQRSRVVKRPSVSQQQDTLFSDDDSDPLVHCDNDQNITNDTPTFEDKPEHLYGLDNPTKVVTEGKDESENAQAKPITKQQHGDDKTEITLLKNRIRKLEQAQSNQGIQYSISFYTVRSSLAACVLKHAVSFKAFQDHAYQKVLLKDQSKTCEGKPVENIIEEALRRWDADKIGIPDYALESAGGQIHGANHSPTFANGAIPQVLVFGIPVWYDVKLPRVIIQPGNTPGECWAFQGSSGFIVLKLSRLIKPTSFTLEHMATTLSQFEDHSIPSAPREFTVWGWADARGNEKALLGEYVYNDGGHALQNFPVQATIVPEFRYIELKVLSNYGNPVFTCLYRFRVHGLPYKTNN
ncbi:SUN domain-containing protein 2 [Stylophora pistillata]|uniref:SUN domain-containing protein 2 n=1 Tax=Stylophora pistillata TaxID=50429 RepID=A0A2B4SQR0_STYPI|nr:SUN domain-containing protein 2 [Stylophora pistillata]